MKEQWIKIKDLISIDGLPSSVQGINQKAKQENWIRRRVIGVKGRAYEYSIDSLPIEIQRKIEKQNNSKKEEHINEYKPINETIDEDSLRKIIEAIEKLLLKRQQRISPEKKAKLILLVYKSLKNNDQIDIETINDILDIAI